MRVERVPGEVDPLLQSVNELMARLDEILSFQNRFIADAAHQLRTPVAGLKAHIELALRETDPARARQSLAHLYTSVERISRLVSQLLSLARNEGGVAAAASRSRRSTSASSRSMWRWNGCRRPTASASTWASRARART